MPDIETINELDLQDYIDYTQGVTKWRTIFHGVLDRAAITLKMPMEDPFKN